MYYLIKKSSSRINVRFKNCYKSLQVKKHFKTLGCWNEELNTDIKHRIEKTWKDYVLYGNETIRSASNNADFYVLPMFPYPSGNLHMGHVRVYSISDAIARFHKLNGSNVIHPIGWDAFGLPAENAAIEHNVPPDKWTSSNINTMKKQLLQLGLGFNWDREFSTCSEHYYKWTQYIFLKLYEKGLVYQNKSLVNWDPVDQTVLADEQVDSFGCSWRSGAKVQRRILTQWFIKTSKFAKQLYDGLNDPILENWKDIKNLQEHWIGDCNGITVTFDLIPKNSASLDKMDIWSSEPYKFIYGQFIAISKHSILAQNESQDNNLNRELPFRALNPVNDSDLPIYITDDIEYPEGRDVYIACPSVCANDAQIAKKLNISFSYQINEININEANKQAINVAITKNVGGYLVSSKLKDWLISRQRYWGTPIPIIHCNTCGIVPVPYSDLPVVLPNSKGIGTMLDIMEEWVTCLCPNCNSQAKRETDTMDTFVDSSWYYYRFLDAKNDTFPFDRNKLGNGVTPVNMYIGGKEHAVLHLYYARFMSHFLYSLGWTLHPEPFKKLLVQGMVMGQSYRVKSTGKYVPVSDVDKIGDNYVLKSNGDLIETQWEKMSKSKYNGENPERLLADFGCDTTRLFMLSDVPPPTSRHWSDATFPGCLNWQRRIWMTMRDFLKFRKQEKSEIKQNVSPVELMKYEDKIRDARNYFTATTTYHYKYTQQLSVGISRLQSLTSVLRNNVPPEVIVISKEYELALASLIIMLAPITPHFACELWSGLCLAPQRVNVMTPLINWNENVMEQHWPKVDNDYELSLMCKVDGVDRCNLKVKCTDLNKMTEEDALQIMVSKDAVANRIKRGITRTQWNLFPDCRAILYVYTNRSENKTKKQLMENKM